MYVAGSIRVTSTSQCADSCLGVELERSPIRSTQITYVGSTGQPPTSFYAVLFYRRGETEGAWARCRGVSVSGGQTRRAPAGREALSPVSLVACTCAPSGKQYKYKMPDRVSSRDKNSRKCGSLVQFQAGGGWVCFILKIINFAKKKAAEELNT